MENTETQKQKIMLVPLPLQGHLTPMLQLGSLLHSKGFSVTVAHTDFNSPNPRNHPDFAFVSFQEGVRFPSGNLLEMIVSINTSCREPLEKNILELQAQGQVSCIIYDSLMSFVEAVSRRLKLPSIFFRPTTAVYMQTYHAVLSLHENMMIPMQGSHLEDSVPQLHPVIRFKDLPISASTKISEPLLDFVKSFSDIKSSVATIWNSMEMLDDFALKQLQNQYKVPSPFLPNRPSSQMASSSSSSSLSTETSLLEEDTSCIAWLDKQAPKSVLYISLGSLATFAEKVLIETAWGIYNSGQPFLWAIRPSSVSGSDWIECLPRELREKIRERGLIVKWAPQKKVLEHSAVGGFLSHCGWNSTLESVCEGVAMICRPFFGDQRVNARFLVHVWGVGVEIEDVEERKSIEEGVRMVMVDEGGKEMRRRAVEMKEKVELSWKKGGSSSSSLDKLAHFITSLPTMK